MFRFGFDLSKLKRRLIVFIINRFIGKYVSNTIDRKSIKLNDSGFTIKELELDPSLFEIFDGFVEMEDNIITDLQVFMPWPNILTESSKLSINKISLTFNWNFKEKVNVTELAETILHRTMNAKDFETYIEKSVYEDRSYLLNNKTSNNSNDYDMEGLGQLQSVISGFFDNIQIACDFIDIKINFPDDICLNLQLYGINIVQTEFNEELMEESLINNDIEKTITVDEITVLINKRTIISLQSVKIDVWTQEENTEGNQYNSLDVYGINVNIDFIYVYTCYEIAESLLPLIKCITPCFVVNGHNNSAKSHKILFGLNIRQWKYIYELDEDNQICSISNDIYFKYESKPIWGNTVGDNLRNTQLYKSKDVNFFPLEMSTSPKVDSIMSSIQSSISQQMTTYEGGIANWEIYELNQFGKYNLITSLNKTDYFVKLSFNGGLFDKINVQFSPILFTLDLTFIDKYLPIIKLLSAIGDNKGHKKGIFKQKNIVNVFCELVHVIIKIPISKRVKLKKETHNNNLYEESLFIDIHDLHGEFNNKATTLTCQKILGNLLNKENIINFLSVKVASKDKPIVFQIFGNSLYDEERVSDLPDWFNISHMAVGQQEVEINKNVKSIDILNRDVMRKSKSIIKLNLRHCNLYLDHQHFQVIQNLLSEFAAWESPFPAVESFYMLINCRLEALSINMTHPTFQYTILAEMINVMNAMNFFTNHKFTYFQIKDLYLYNNLTKRIILKKIDSREPNIVRVSIDQQFPTPLSKDLTIAVEFSKVKLLTRHEEFSRHEKDCNFWVFDFINFFKKEYDVEPILDTRTKLYLNVNRLSVGYKIWNIPSKIIMDFDDISFLNTFIGHDSSYLYSISSNYFDVGLAIKSRNIKLVHNKFLNVIWKGTQVELINGECLFEVCIDSIHIINGIIQEFKKRHDKLELVEDDDDETETETEITCNNEQLKDIEKMVNDAIKPVSYGSSVESNNANSVNKSIVAFSIYQLRNKSVSGSYDKMNSVFYSPLAKCPSSCFIVRDFNMEIKLHSGLDVENMKNHNNYLSSKLEKINLIWFKSEDKIHQKLFTTIRQIETKLISNKITTILTPDISYTFKSWSLLDDSDMALLNHIYCLNGGFQKKATHFLDWSNHLGFVMSIDNEAQENWYKFDTQPIVFNLNQESINFLLEYTRFQPNYLEKYYKLDQEYIEVEDANQFTKTSLAKQPHNVVLDINSIKLIINYKSSVFDLAWNNNAMILNFVNLDETKLVFKPFRYMGKQDTDLITYEISEYYMDQIKGNNSLNIIKSLSPIRTAIKIGSGIVNLIVIPSSEGLRGSKWKYGLQRGVEKFKSSTLSELANIGYKIMNTADKLINGREEETITLTLPRNEYNASGIHNHILNLTKNSIKSGKQTMLELKDNLSGKTKKEQLQLEYKKLEKEFK